MLIAYDDLRNVNGKLVELKHEKEINNILKSIIKNDSVIIDTLTIDNNKLTNELKAITNDTKKYKKQRNAGFIIGIVGIMIAIISLIK